MIKPYDDLYFRFSKVINEPVTERKKNFYGTVKVVPKSDTDAVYVVLDNSNRPIPVYGQNNVQVGDRVSIEIRNHCAKIVGVFKS